MGGRNCRQRNLAEDEGSEQSGRNRADASPMRAESFFVKRVLSRVAQKLVALNSGNSYVKPRNSKRNTLAQKMLR
jgi:hypothetical protein